MAEKHLLLIAVAKRIREVRKARGVTTEQLAEQLGVSVQRVRQIESGHENLTLETIHEVAGKLGAILTVSLDLGSPDPIEPVPTKRPRRRVTRSR